MYMLHPEIPQDCQRFIAGLPCLPKYCPHFHNHALREAFLQSQNQICNTTTPQANTFKDSFGDKKGNNYMSEDNKNNNNSVNINRRKNSGLSNKFSKQNTHKTSDHGAGSAYFPVLDESKKALNERRNQHSAKSFKAESETSQINSFSPLERRSMQDMEPRESKDFNPITHIPITDLSINYKPLELNSDRLEGDFNISGASSISNPDASNSRIRNFKDRLDSESFSFVKSPLPQIIAKAENDPKPIVNLPKIDNRIPCRPKINDQTEISNISPATQSSIDGDNKYSFIFFETSYPIECISKPEYSDANTKDVFLAKDLRHPTKQDFKIGFGDWENKNEPFVNTTSHLKRDNSRPRYNGWDERHVSFDDNMTYETGCNPEKDRCDWNNGQVSFVNVKIQSTACDLRPRYNGSGRRNESLENSTGYQKVHSLEQSYSGWDIGQVYFVNVKSHSTACDLRPRYNDCERRNESLENSTGYKTVHSLEHSYSDWNNGQASFVNDTNHTTRYDSKVRYNDPEKRDLSHSNSVGHQTGYVKKRRYNSCDRGNVSFKNKASHQTRNRVEEIYSDLDKRRVSIVNDTNHTTGYDPKTMLNEWEKGDLSPSNKTPHQIGYIASQSSNGWDKAQLSSGISTSHSTGCNPNQSYNDWYEGDLSPATNTSHPTLHDLNLESSDGKERDDSLNNNSNQSTGINPKRKYNFWDKRHPSNDNCPSHQSRYNLKSSYRDGIKRDVSLFNGLSHPKGHYAKLEYGDRNTGDISSPIDVSNLTEQVSKPESRDGVKRVVSTFNTKIHPLGYNPKPRQNDGEKKNISLANDTCYLTERNSNPKYDGEKKDTPLTIDTNNMTEKISIPENNDGEKKDTPLAIQASNHSENNLIPKYNEDKKDTSLAINTGYLIENKANPKHNEEEKTDTPLTIDTNNMTEKILIPEKNDGEKKDTLLEIDAGHLKEKKMNPKHNGGEKKDKSLANDTSHVTEKSPDLNLSDGNTIDMPVVVETSHSRECFPGKKYTDNKEISVTTPVYHPSAKRSTKQKIADLDAKFQIREVNKSMDSLRMQWINNLSPEIKQAYFRDTTVEKNNKPSRNLNFKRRPMISLVSKSSGEQSFALFRNLPSEIRNQIWNYAKQDCSTTCYVQLDVKQDPGGRCEIVNGKSVLIPNPILDAKFSYLYDIPGLFGACRESHSIVKDFYGKSKITAFNQATQRPFISGQGSCIFNYEQDRLFFLTSGTVSRLPECVDFMRDDERNMIRHLAIPLKDYFHEPRTTVDALVRFRHLKTLNLVIGDGKDDKEVIGSEDYGRSLRNDLRGQHINDDREISEEYREKWTLPYVKVEYVDQSQAHAWGIDDLKWEATMRPIRR